MYIEYFKLATELGFDQTSLWKLAGDHRLSKFEVSVDRWKEGISLIISIKQIQVIHSHRFINIQILIKSSGLTAQAPNLACSCSQLLRVVHDNKRLYKRTAHCSRAFVER